VPHLPAPHAHGAAGEEQPGPGAGHGPADRWWARFTFNGITAYGDGLYSLIGGVELSDTERDALQQLCRQRLDTFREQRGEEVACLFAEKPAASATAAATAPRSAARVKHRVFTRARGRCECCGAHEHQRALEVDHIVPKNQGGSDAMSNLQALCFRGVQDSYGHRESGCVFCALEDSGRVLLENELALCIADVFPVSEGHSLVISRRHGADGLELHQPEWNAVVELLKLRREQLSAQDATISGWAGLLNARGGLNSGEAAGQTVIHAHWHLIPRRLADCEQPRGGVRGVIPSRQAY
jgi:diadenosine tetraphosphate (Ap4A) HIT family hydrolase